MGQDIPDRVVSQSRAEFINSWFDDEVPEAVRVEALRYLGEYGRLNDQIYIEREFNKKDGATLSVALEAWISLLLRHEGARSAASFAISNSFDELSGVIMAPMLVALEELDTDTLQQGLNHRSAAVRFKSLCILSDRGAVPSDRARQLFEDPVLRVREKAISIVGVLEDRRWSPDEAHPIIIRKVASDVFGSAGRYDWEGEEALERLQVEEQSRNSKPNLQAVADSGNHSWSIAYQALGRRHFSSFASALRYDFDNRFQQRFERYIQATRDLGSNSLAVQPLVDQMLRSGDFTRREWMRRAADILVERAEAADLPRIRKALDDDAMDPSQKDITFIGSHGDWEDIKRIEKIYSDYRSRGHVATILTSKPPTLVASKALLRLTRKRVPELLKSDLSGDLMAAVAFGFSNANFARLSNEELITVMSHQNDGVRKVTALKVVEVHTEKRTRRLAEAYSEQSYRYYNVVRWLDLAYGFESAIAKRAAKRELMRFATRWS